jgi:uncharacterized protein (TIGR02246 family)
MIKRISVATSFAVTLGAAAASSQPPAGTRAEIDAFYGAWMGAAVKQGPAAYASFYDTDGMMLPPNDRPLAGRAAIEAFQTRSQADSPYTVKPTGIQVDEVRFLEADWVVYRSTLSGLRIPKAGGEPGAFATKYFDVLHKGSDGRWQVAYRIWSDNMR